MKRQAFRAGVFLAAVATFVVAAEAPSAFANTRGNAGSYMNHVENLDVVPGDPSGFIVGNGVTVWMNCWEGGPQAMGQGKWFSITVNNNGGAGYGATGYVPAPSVSNQWTQSPPC